MFDALTCRLVHPAARLPVLVAIAACWVIAVLGERFGPASHFFILAYLCYRFLMELVDNPKDAGRSQVAHLLAGLWLMLLGLIIARTAQLLIGV